MQFMAQYSPTLLRRGINKETLVFRQNDPRRSRFRSIFLARDRALTSVRLHVTTLHAISKRHSCKVCVKSLLLDICRRDCINCRARSVLSLTQSSHIVVDDSHLQENEMVALWYERARNEID
jgi:hypothetical protein